MAEQSLDIKMKRNKLFILFLVLLVLPIFVSAVLKNPVFETGSSTSHGYDIESPVISYIELNTNFSFVFHVFNISDGLPITNSTALCEFNLYDKRGESIIHFNQIANNSFFNAYRVMVVNNFTEEGNYNYIVHCNSSHRGGFLGSSFLVTNTGDDDSVTDTSSGIAITLFILICAGLFLLLPIFINKFSKNDFVNVILKRCCFVVGIYLMVLNSAILATISKSAHLGLEKEMFRYSWIFGWFGYMFMAFVVLKTLFDVLKMWKVEKEEKRMGKKNGEN